MLGYQGWPVRLFGRFASFRQVCETERGPFAIDHHRDRTGANVGGERPCTESLGELRREYLVFVWSKEVCPGRNPAPAPEELVEKAHLPRLVRLPRVYK